MLLRKIQKILEYWCLRLYNKEKPPSGNLEALGD